MKVFNLEIRNYLVILAVEESKIKLGKALTYTDLVPLTIKSSESWKSNEIKEELLSCISGVVKY